MSLVSTQPRNLPLLITSETCLGGTYIVTGANTGLGFEAAKHLVAVGAAKVILGVRNVSAGKTAKAEIETETGTSSVAEVWELDLASYDSVKAFVKRAIEELGRIDALIENAGVALAERVMAEGHLASVTVNVLSTFLLAVLLLPKLSESARQFGILPHIVVVGSSASFEVEEDWNNIKDDPLVKVDEAMVVKTYVTKRFDAPLIYADNSLASYRLTKLMEIMAVRHLARLIPVSRTGVVMNLVCPGLCVTDLTRNAPPSLRERIDQQRAQYGRTAEDGSRTLLYGAIAGEESHGCYLDSCKIAE